MSTLCEKQQLVIGVLIETFYPAIPSGSLNRKSHVALVVNILETSALIKEKLWMVDGSLEISRGIIGPSLWRVCWNWFLQVGTLRELQRLYDELVESAVACKLDRYTASDKSGRFIFHFVSHVFIFPLDSSSYQFYLLFWNCSFFGFDFKFNFATIFFIFRSRWLWSRLMPQSSYSPIKGLYLYGGVGTGKTMLMDLFFNQL